MSSKPLTIGSVINCVDNSGAKKIKIIGVLGLQGTKNRNLSCGIGNEVICTVTKGLYKLMKTVQYGLIIRQKVPYERKDGQLVGKVRFTENAGILLNKKVRGLVLKENTIVKGPIAKEVRMISKYADLKGQYK